MLYSYIGLIRTCFNKGLRNGYDTSLRSKFCGCYFQKDWMSTNDIIIPYLLCVNRVSGVRISQKFHVMYIIVHYKVIDAFLLVHCEFSRS